MGAGVEPGTVWWLLGTVLGSGVLGAAVPALINRWKPKEDRLSTALERADKELAKADGELAKAEAITEVLRQLITEFESYVQQLRDHIYRGAEPPPPVEPEAIRDLRRLIVNIMRGKVDP